MSGLYRYVVHGRNCHQAIERVLELHRQGYKVVLDADIAGFFDNVPHRVIREAVAFGKGYEFPGFFLSSRSRRMRDKSVQKFKAKIREFNVDAPLRNAGAPGTE